MKLLSIVVCFLCVNSLMASETYKAGVLLQNKEINEFTPFIQQAGQTGLDILVLPSLPGSADKYDELVNSISKTARQAGVYIATHLYEKARCGMAYETVRSNLVFDRNGDIAAVYRKPQNGIANCTTPHSDLVTFTTDFGVTFGLVMEEDLALYDAEHFKGVNNFVMAGEWESEVALLNAATFAPSWSYIMNANLVSTAGIYAGKAGLKTGEESLLVAELNKNGGSASQTVLSIKPSTFHQADLSQYVIRPLDLEASSMGYKDTICHRSFCCEFYVKTASGSKNEASYKLAAFNGVLPVSDHHNIAAEICLISGSENSDTVFERISVTANFTKQNAQFPLVQSAILPAENFKFTTKASENSQQVTLEAVNVKSLQNVGIFGKDSAVLEDNYVYGEKNNTETVQNDIYEYIFNEDVQEFFDYVWIRLRILIVVVSIYILEMM
ncbi:vanin-like protein 1 [Helicoverpa armigera]|uniref:vanin-like protein 1 n=1 Tax=Helicoverpa armigera TaxID=29058 RepID=UPI0030832520